MATGQTPTYLLPYPLSTDSVDVHGDIFELADRLEDVIGGLSSLPSQSGNNGKFLTTNGSVASWATIPVTAAATPTVIGTVFGRTYPETVDGSSQYVNVAIGRNALASAVGSDSLDNGNVAVGVDSLNTAVGGEGSVAIGHQSGKNATGNRNTFVGGHSGNSVVGGNNVAIGAYAMDVSTMIPTDVTENVAIGDGALHYLESGLGNIAIGASSAYDLLSGSNNIVIGYDTSVPDGSNNIIKLGNGDSELFELRGLSTIVSGSKGFFTPVVTENIWEDTGVTLNGAIDFDLSTGNSVYYSNNATANWQLNLRWDSVVSFDTASFINQLDASRSAATIVIMAKQGATPYYCTQFKVDGVAQTVKWQGGTAPSAGNANSIDVYTYTVIPVSPYAPTYLVIGSMTKFA